MYFHLSASLSPFQQRLVDLWQLADKKERVTVLRLSGNNTLIKLIYQTHFNSLKTNQLGAAEINRIF